jgi:hypothetical protein
VGCVLFIFRKWGEDIGFFWRRWLAYAIGFLFICFSLYLYVQFTNQYKETVTTMRTLKPLRPLQAGEVMSENMVQSVVIPIAAHDTHAITEMNDIRGKKLKVPLSTGDEFADWKLADVLIAPDNEQRYFSFKTDALQNVANMVRRGDRVDVWVEFEVPKRYTDEQGEKHWLGSIKLLENVLVADVKSPEGAEVVDTNDANRAFQNVHIGVLQNNIPDMEQFRAKPNAKPEENTYIMTAEEYNVYVIGTLSGKIKLSLANLFTPSKEHSKVSDSFYQFQNTDFFNKETKMQAN